jgi:hypothetical protein
MPKVSARPASWNPRSGLQATALSFVHSSSNNNSLSPSAPIFVPPSVPSVLARKPDQRNICRFFLGGACRNGLDCPFVHDASGNTIVKESAAVPESSHISLYHLEDGIKCEFAPGATIVQLTLGMEPSTDDRLIVVSGLSENVTEHDVEVRLSPFGSLLSLSLKRADKNNAPSYATATFSEAGMAKAAAAALHGSTASTWEGVACSANLLHSRTMSNAAVSVVVKSRSGAASTAAIVKVQWYAPSRCAWIFFSNRANAEKAAQVCSGQELQGRTLTAKTSFPTTIRHSRHGTNCRYSIWLGNIGEYSTIERLKKFVERNAKCSVMSVTLGDLCFADKTSPAIVQKLLRTHGGPLTSFELSKVTKEAGLKRRALVRFAEARDAEKACIHFLRCDKVNELGGSKLFLQRIFTVKYTLPTRVFEAIKKDIESILQQVSTIRHSIFDNATTKSISIQADKQATIAAIKKKLDPLVSGDVVRDPRQGSRVLWTRYVATPQFDDDMTRLCDIESACIWRDTRRREVRVFGHDEQCRKKISGTVLKHCEEMMIETHSVPISHSEFKFILMNGRSTLDKITLATKCRKVSLGAMPSLLVEGSSIDARRARAYVSKIVAGEIDEKQQQVHDSLCPVCFCPPENDPDPVVYLSCGHSYCRDCFQTWLMGGNLCTFPLVCLTDSCSTSLALSDLIENLEAEGLHEFTSNSYGRLRSKELNQATVLCFSHMSRCI